MTRPLSVHDVPEKPAVIEFTERLSANESMRIFPHSGCPISTRRLRTITPGLGWPCSWIEMEGPLVDVWPPPLTTRLLAGVDLSQGDAGRCGNDPAAVRSPGVSPAAPGRRAGPLLAPRQDPARQGLHFRGGPARRLEGGPVQPGVSLPIGEPRQTERLRSGDPAVVFPVEHHARRRADESRRQERARQAGRAAAAGRAHAQGPQGPGLHREFHRPMAEPAEPESDDPGQEALSRFRRTAGTVDAARDAPVLRGDSQGRPQRAGIRPFGLVDAERAAGGSLRHPGRAGVAVSQGETCRRAAIAAAS